ncbi:MAG: formylglycine-generating enzyme family protein [Sedimenticola sp.]
MHQTTPARWRSRTTLLQWILLTLFSGLLQGAEPGAAAHLTSRQAGEQVILEYQLTGVPGSRNEIIFELSLDGGKSWRKPEGKTSGDLGRGVTPGKGKRITWDARGDFPDGINQPVDFRVETKAEREATVGIATCQSHLKANRLTSGRGGNAADCFSEILKRNPNNLKALEGLNAIEAKYLAWAESALQRGQNDKVNGYLAKVERLNPESEALRGFRERQTDAVAESKRKQQQAKAERAAQARAAAEAEKRRQAAARKPYEPEMVKIPGGSFRMGSNSGHNDEKPVHRVTLQPFELGKYEVTQAQWRAVMGDNPSHFKGCDNCPVEQVSWDDIQGFIETLNRKTGKQYRLPTEAEWEYACRSGGRDEKYCGGSSPGSLAWYDDNSGNKTHPVGQKQPNGLGLYDMSGNVWEWIHDCWNGSYAGAPSDGTAWERGECGRRVVRGGSWGSGPGGLRAANRGRGARGNRYSLRGFRLARVF